jgi:pre-mRNA-splicing factor ISY1
MRRKQMQLPPRLHMPAAAAYIPLLFVESLLPLKMPTKGEMEGVLLELGKRELVEEYFGN